MIDIMCYIQISDRNKRIMRNQAVPDLLSATRTQIISCSEKAGAGVGRSTTPRATSDGKVARLFVQF